MNAPAYSIGRGRRFRRGARRGRLWPAVVRRRSLAEWLGGYSRRELECRGCYGPCGLCR